VSEASAFPNIQTQIAPQTGQDRFTPCGRLGGLATLFELSGRIQTGDLGGCGSDLLRCHRADAAESADTALAVGAKLDARDVNRTRGDGKYESRPE
jgi:hypothetical protein